MIVTERGQELWFFTQTDHAALASAVMTLWRHDGLPDHPRRQDLLLAIREHDNGWREDDAAPRIEASSGRPLSFNEIALNDRLRIWKRGVRRFAAKRPYPAMLVLRHAIEIHRDQWGSAAWEEIRPEFAELEQDLCERSGVARSEVGDDYRFLELADILSLGACGAPLQGSAKGVKGGYRFALELGRIALSPFPLAGSTTLDIAYRTLIKKPFDNAASLATGLATTTWHRFPVHIEPLDDG